ncbi:hypothetical protein NLG97_g7539 [Lecanicillium saksenae]|uniref:Uncharacterized protein n=1 Tax=Lecanicillium saksenae TaxID=468837 RepID=A0ACC1QLI4_9HYPO|nr:hypothetical protein NLG97_g7539 [Lecanicillium saksenae]
MAASTVSDECAAYLQAPSFNKSFVVPATPDRGALNISYSDLGKQAANDGSSSPPVLLFMPGMHATRFQAVFLHLVAVKMGVRVLTVDRFGFGQTKNVRVDQRLSTWVEIVPLLLAHLNIPHVALASHSAGTLYLLNTLASCRRILSPTRPYAVLFSPFVDIKHSGVKLLQAAQLIPNAAIGYFDTLTKSLDAYVGPVVGSSISIMDKWFSSEEQPNPARAATRARWENEYGVSSEFLNNIGEACFRAGMAENSEGLNDETRLCLKKGCTWDACDDYDELVKTLTAREVAAASPARLRVKILFAQQDAMIGERGARYMKDCWERNCGPETGRVIDLCTKTVDGTDHDSLCTKLVALEEVMRDVLGQDEAAESEASHRVE